VAEKIVGSNPIGRPINMDFFQRKISTLAGIIILLLITSAVGGFIIYQFNEINNIKIHAMERMIEQ
jgi:hypothetical protein